MLINRSVIYLFGVVYFPLFLDYAGLGIEYLLTLGLVVILGIEVLNNRSSVRSSLIISCVFLFLTLISLMRSLEFTVYRDVAEVVKPILFFVVFNYAVGLVHQENDLEKLSKNIIILFVSMALFGLLESRIGAVNHLASIIYKGSREPVQFKGVLSFISPYTFASLIILPIFFSISGMIFLRGKLKYFIIFLISLFCLIFTQSKTVFLSFVFSLAIFPVVLLSKSWLPKRVSLLLYFVFTVFTLIITVPIILVYAEENLRYLYYGFNVVLSQVTTLDAQSIIYSTPSISNRYEQMMEVIKFQDVLPILGKGIVKELIYPESFYALYLLRYGIIGIIINFCLIYVFCKYSLNLAKTYSKKDRFLMCFFIGLFIYGLSLPISYFSSAVNDQTRSGFIFYFLLGYLYAANRVTKK